MTNVPLNDQDPGQPANDAGYAALMAVKPGEKLKKARNNRKLDLEAAAGQLNLSVGVLEALESDDYDALPSSTFIKGYIRSYARFLNLSGDDLVRAFEYQTGVHSSMDEQHPLPDAPRKKAGRLALVVVIALIASLAVWLLSGGGEEQTNEPANSAADASIESPIETPADQQAPIESQANKDSTVVDKEIQAAVEETVDSNVNLELAKPVIEALSEVADVPLEVQQAAEQEARIEPEPIKVIPEKVEAPAVEVTSAKVIQEQLSENFGATDNAAPFEATTGNLVMTFSDDCWVEIRDGNEKLIHANLHRAGSRFSKTLAEPFDIKLGNGNVVEVFYNDNPMAFAKSKRSNVARLSIGTQ